MNTKLLAIALFLLVGCVLEYLAIPPANMGIILFVFYFSLSLLLWSNLRALVLITTFTLLLEAIGLWTSIPFGNYVYGKSVAFPSIAHVPLFIPFAWYILISASAQVSARWYYAGLLIVLFDIVLECFATVTGLWSWPGHTGLLTAPFQNYLTWAAVASAGYFLIPKKKNQYTLSIGILSLLTVYMIFVMMIYHLR